MGSTNFFFQLHLRPIELLVKQQMILFPILLLSLLFFKIKACLWFLWKIWENWSWYTLFELLSRIRIHCPLVIKIRHIPPIMLNWGAWSKKKKVMMIGAIKNYKRFTFNFYYDCILARLFKKHSYSGQYLKISFFCQKPDQNFSRILLRFLKNSSIIYFFYPEHKVEVPDVISWLFWSEKAAE